MSCETEVVGEERGLKANFFLQNFEDMLLRSYCLSFHLEFGRRPLLLGPRCGCTFQVENSCGNGEEEKEGCCIEGATASDYIYKRAESASNRGSRKYSIHSVLCERRCQADNSPVI
jgi:hypothetical protein